MCIENLQDDGSFDFLVRHDNASITHEPARSRYRFDVHEEGFWRSAPFQLGPNLTGKVAAAADRLKADCDLAHRPHLKVAIGKALEAYCNG